jgi:pimeloyl-ACP methyl ester carboxylesterase
MMPATKFVDLPDRLRLSYVEQGDPTGHPVVLLHGVSDSCLSFGLLLPHLPPSLHVFAISQRGHGDSERPLLGYAPRNFAADLAGFIEFFDLGPAVIVGHSMSSSIAERFALDHLEHVSGMILVGAFSAGWQNSSAAVELWDRTVSTMTDPVDPGFVRKFQESTLSQQVPSDFLDMVVEESLKLPACVWQAVFESFRSADFSAAFSAIEVPTLIVWGEQDAICPRSEQLALASAIRGARLISYAEAGHAPHWEEPRRFAGDLLDFVQNVAARTAGRGVAADAGASSSPWPGTVRNDGRPQGARR